MNFLKDKNTIIGLIVLVIVGCVAYSYLNGSTAPTDQLIVTDSSNVDPFSIQVLAALQKVTSLKIDQTVFTTIDSLGLKDFGKDLPDNPNLGRPNPFEPISFGRSTSTQALPGGGSQTLKPIATSTASSTR